MIRRRAVLIAAFVGYLLMACIPLAVAFFSSQARLLAPRPLWDDVASSIAMIGFAAILIEFVLLGRFRTLSTTLGSDFLMQAHQLLARTALAFIVAHPFLYSLWGHAHQPQDHGYAAALKIDGLSLLTGALAWLLVLILVFSATRREGYDYDRWRRWHAIVASVLVGVSTHHVLAAGRYSAFTPLAAYWWLLIGIAAAAFITVYVIRPMIQKRRAYAISDLKPVAKNIYALSIVPTGSQHLDVQPGQFAWIKVGSTAVTHDHPFSIASSPQPSRELRFLVKAVGDFTASLAKASIGTKVYVDGPHGHFQIPSDAKAIIMIAGGIGIAPFCGLLQYLADTGDRRPIRLIYANRLSEQEIDVSRFANISRLADFKMISVIGEPQPHDQGITGQLELRVLSQILSHADFGAVRDQAVFMVCGPAAMIDAVEGSLVALNISLGRIISEKFQYDFNLKAPRSKRTMIIWLCASALLLAAALTAPLR